MKRTKYRFIIVIAMITVVIFALFAFVKSPPDPLKGNFVLELQEPVFVEQARAENSELGTYLDNEAGISAYFLSPDVINLSSIRSQCLTIEADTPDYIICSVAVPNHPEIFGVHVYVHRTGWVMAYYMNTDPAAKIMDLRSAPGQNLQTTILQNVLVIIANAGNIPFTSATYYDFRYPNATNMMFVRESADSGTCDSFEITIPSSIIVYQRSWAFYTSYGYYYLDDVRIDNTGPGYGLLTASQLSPDITHVFRECTHQYAYGHAGLAIIYRVP